MVLTSHSVNELARSPSELSFEELSVPYYTFSNAGCELAFASPAGGAPPFAPRISDGGRADASGLADDREARALLADTVELGRVSADDFNAVYYAGGLGAVVDLRFCEPSKKLIAEMMARNRPVGLIGPAVAALLDVHAADRCPLLNERRVTGMTLSEYRALSGGALGPESVEEAIVRVGGIFCHRDENASHVECDANLVTGQNQQSAGRVATEILRLAAWRSL